MNSSASQGGDPEALERQSDAIRADMGQTLAALERKLSPGQLLDRALQLAKEHGGEAAANLGRTAKDNPVPLLLTAVGIAWLMSSQSRTTDRLRYSSSDANRYGEGATGNIGESVGEKLDEVRSRTTEAAEHLGEKISDARARLHGTAESMRDSMHRAADQSRRMRATFQSMLEEQPLAVGAIAVGVGALLGSLLPETEQEDRLMGQTREKVLERAQGAAREGYERAREAVLGAGEAAEDTAAEEQQRPH